MNFHCYFSLQTKSIGCRLGNMIINHLLFADIAVDGAARHNVLWPITCLRLCQYS